MALKPYFTPKDYADPFPPAWIYGNPDAMAAATAWNNLHRKYPPGPDDFSSPPKSEQDTKRDAIVNAMLNQAIRSGDVLPQNLPGGNQGDAGRDIGTVTDITDTAPPVTDITDTGKPVTDITDTPTPQKGEPQQAPQEAPTPVGFTATFSGFTPSPPGVVGVPALGPNGAPQTGLTAEGLQGWGQAHATPATGTPFGTPLGPNGAPQTGLTPEGLIGWGKAHMAPPFSPDPVVDTPPPTPTFETPPTKAELEQQNQQAKAEQQAEIDAMNPDFAPSPLAMTTQNQTLSSITQNQALADAMQNDPALAAAVKGDPDAAAKADPNAQPSTISLGQTIANNPNLSAISPNLAQAMQAHETPWGTLAPQTSLESITSQIGKAPQEKAEMQQQAPIMGLIAPVMAQEEDPDAPEQGPTVSQTAHGFMNDMDKADLAVSLAQAVAALQNTNVDIANLTAQSIMAQQKADPFQALADAYAEVNQAPTSINQGINTAVASPEAQQQAAVDAAVAAANAATNQGFSTGFGSVGTPGQGSLGGTGFGVAGGVSTDGGFGAPGVGGFGAPSGIAGVSSGALGGDSVSGVTGQGFGTPGQGGYGTGTIGAPGQGFSDGFGQGATGVTGVTGQDGSVAGASGAIGSAAAAAAAAAAAEGDTGGTGTGGGVSQGGGNEGAAAAGVGDW